MSGEGILDVVGNLTDDPELRYTKNGTAVCGFAVANTPRAKNAATGTWENEPTVYYNCTVWGPPAENVAATLRKGQRVIVKGAIHDDSYTNKEGKKVTGIKVVVEHVGPDLRFATATVTSSRGDNHTPSSSPFPPSAPAQPTGGYEAPPF
jgi:single-strand DNA-binding protein